ncbi:DUF4065 domain-containing protein [Fructobacillus sp. W13]|uniref:DUF4065 domain-containing protein n=1 Tax=Fructobacillus apis TaxID=2935017 RepID=A0ABT0ZRR5_9LACO|nr:type II toxin-antitoxin system antitoxin SocA domain-containing protein [Fructobacillus apis]MCO0832677.1 DUF4065 domain-containing protein [Fructobacillus apis]
MKTWKALQVVDWMRGYNFGEMKDNPAVEELTQLKAMKLLYYAQGVALAVFDQPIIQEPIVAYRLGPVVEEVHRKYNHRRAIVNITMPDGFVVNEENGIDPDAYENFSEISEDRESNAVLSRVMEVFGDESAIELMERTHEERPWKETKQNEEINLDLIKAFFLDEIVKVDD